MLPRSSWITHRILAHILATIMFKRSRSASRFLFRIFWIGWFSWLWNSVSYPCDVARLSFPCWTSIIHRFQIFHRFRYGWGLFRRMILMTELSRWSKIWIHYLLFAYYFSLRIWLPSTILFWMVSFCFPSFTCISNIVIRSHLFDLFRRN